MHGLINKAIEVFVKQTYGDAAWCAAMRATDLGLSEFEAMLIYPDTVTAQVLSAVSDELGQPVSHLLEDMGTFLVASPTQPAFRRLLRFGGTDYVDFLHSLEDLPDRVRLALDDLVLPALHLTESTNHRFVLRCDPGLSGYAHVMVGVLRAMADDYGALAILDLVNDYEAGAEISIQVIQRAYTAGKAFELGRAHG